MVQPWKFVASQVMCTSFIANSVFTVVQRAFSTTVGMIGSILVRTGVFPTSEGWTCSGFSVNDISWQSKGIPSMALLRDYWGIMVVDNPSIPFDSRLVYYLWWMFKVLKLCQNCSLIDTLASSEWYGIYSHTIWTLISRFVAQLLKRPKANCATYLLKWKTLPQLTVCTRMFCLFRWHCGFFCEQEKQPGNHRAPWLTILDSGLVGKSSNMFYNRDGLNSWILRFRRDFVEYAPFVEQ